jgi:DNA invertase Pin-like site-specific DNA recombinase
MTDGTPMKAALYMRVSKAHQELDNQRRILTEYAGRRGWAVVKEYTDIEHGDVAGRNGLSDMIQGAFARHYDVLIVAELSRLSRGGVGPMFAILSKLRGAGVAWVSLREPWADTATAGPIADVMLAVTAWAAEQERKLISARTKAAMARRKALGLPTGRPKGSKDRKPRSRAFWKKPGWLKGGTPAPVEENGDIKTREF